MNINKKRKKFIFRFVVVSVLILITLISLSSCKKEDRIYPETPDELNGLRAAIVVGHISDIVISKEFPESECFYYKNNIDIYEAIRNNKVDYSLNDYIILKTALEEMPEFRIIDLDVLEEKFALFTSKGPSSDSLREEFNDYLAEIRASGYLDELIERWTVPTYKEISQYNLDDIVLTGERGTIRFATETGSIPYVFYANNKLTGLTVELVLRFAEAHGYNIEFLAVDFDALIPAVVSGKCDMGGSTVAITPEREKSVRFTDPYISEHLAAVVMAPGANKGISNLKNALVRTFVEEERWKMILSGFATTLLIVLSSTVFGTLLGLIYYLIFRKGIVVIIKTLDIFAWLLRGLPTVVILMILYYVFFGNSSISGVFIACLAFSIFMSFTVYSLLRSSVESVGNDQLEGALSLGCTSNQAFYKVILPQSMTQFIPNYIAEIISMVKSTAIVGYIAVPDLTKVSDIIRSRTFEAFMPIIATAIIYVIIITLFTLILKSISLRFVPSNRSKERILKKYQS